MGRPEAYAQTSLAIARHSNRVSRVVVTRVVYRLLVALFVLTGISLLTFVIVNELPGSTGQLLIGIDATPEQVVALEARLGLDQPAAVRYAHWLRGILRGDLGRSIASGQPVSVVLVERLPVTLELVGYAFVLALGGAVPLALVAARWPRGLVDRACAIASMAGLSIASYAVAILLVRLLAVQTTWFPAIGFRPLAEGLGGNLRSLTLPAFALAVPLGALYLRFLRGDLIEQMRTADYVLTMRAAGVGPWRVLLGHALPNAWLGLLTVIGLHLGTLVGGTVVIERMFALPGIGQMLLQAVNLRDVIVVQATVLVLAAVAVLANLAVDMSYTVLDPRLRQDA